MQNLMILLMVGEAYAVSGNLKYSSLHNPDKDHNQMKCVNQICEIIILNFYLMDYIRFEVIMIEELVFTYLRLYAIFIFYFLYLNFVFLSIYSLCNYFLC